MERLYDFGRGAVISTLSLSKMFPPLDLDHLRKRLSLRERAIEHGKSNIPAEKSTELNSVEAEILGAGQDAVRQYIDEYETQIEAYQARIEVYRTFMHDFPITNELKMAIGDMKGKVIGLKTELYEQQESIKAFVDEIIRFRRTSNLMHRTPDVHNPHTTLAKLMGAGLIEIVLTAALIREFGDWFTVLGIAFVFFLLNIIFVAFLIANAAKAVNLHKNGKINWVGRSSGTVIFVFFAAYTTTINLVFSHLRAVSSEIALVLQQNPGSYLEIFNSVGNSALQNFYKDGFYLPNPESYGLFLLGVGLSIFAFKLGYSYQDSYPGYGRYKIRYEEMLEDFQFATEGVIDEFKHTRTDGIREVEKIAEDLMSSYAKIPQIIGNATALRERLVQALENLNTDIQVLIQEYREENRRNRSTKPPKYFDSVPQIQQPAIHSLLVNETRSPDTVISEIHDYRDDVFNMFEAAIEEVRDLRSVLDSRYPFWVEQLSNEQQA
jgi:hypothetical protein